MILFFELILGIGGYLYFNVYSNLGSSNIEEDAFRILFIGESTIQGGGGPGKENAYAAQVEELLQEKYPDKKIKSYNKGLDSIETTAILRNLDKNMIKYKPHLVVLMAGWNDYFIPDENASKFKKWYSNFKLYRLIALMRDFNKRETGINSIKSIEDGDFRFIGGPKWGYHYKSFNPLSQVIFNFDSMIDTVHSYGSEIWFAGYLQPDAREKVNPVLQKIAEKNNIIYVGDYPLVDFVTNRSLFADDGWHPSEEGHRIIAEKISERIIQEGIIERW